MQVNTRLITPLLLAGTALLLGWLWWGRQPSVVESAATATPAPVFSGEEADLSRREAAGRGPQPEDGALAAALLQHPRVQAYLQREADREALQDYFDNPGEDPARAEAVWELIETLEAEQRVIGFEALHLKMAWLSLNSPDQQAFRERAEALMTRYREQAERRRNAHDPRRIPGFERYKAMERDIIAEVNAMESVPDGHSRQSYLQQRLQRARVEAYSGGGD